MRAFWIGLVSLILVPSAWAVPAELLNTVTMPLTAEQWVISKSAQVTVGINAAVSDSGLEKIQDEILQKLSQISNQGDWHIISYDRVLDKTGLEHLQFTGQARIPTNALNGLRDKAKSISKPGEVFTVDDIQFTPSAAELRDANTILRADIYQQAKDEIARINKLYPEQRFYLHQIDFIQNIVPGPIPQNMMMAQARVAGSNAGNGGIAVGNKLVINATAVLGAMAGPALEKKPTL